VLVTALRKVSDDTAVCGVNHDSSTSHTSTWTPEPASTSGRVWTTVEGKLTMVAPTGPLRHQLQRQLGTDDVQPEGGNPGQLHRVLLAVGQVAVDVVSDGQSGDGLDVLVGVHHPGLDQRGPDQVATGLHRRWRVLAADPAELVAQDRDLVQHHRHAGEDAEPAPRLRGEAAAGGVGELAAGEGEDLPTLGGGPSRVPPDEVLPRRPLPSKLQGG